MLLLISCYILLVKSEVTYESDANMLTITDEPMITSSMINSYQDSISCYIYSNVNVEIKEHAFKGFETLNRITFTCPQVSINETSFADCSKLKNIFFNYTQVNASKGCFTMNLEHISYDGKNFNSKMFSPFSNDVRIIDIKVQNTCIFDSNDNFFIFHIQTVNIKAKNVYFEESSLIYANMETFTINAIDSINISSNSLKENQIKQFELEAGNSINIDDSAFEDTNLMSIVDYNKYYITSNGTINFGKDAFVDSNIYSLEIKSKGNMIFGSSSLMEVHGNEIIINCDRGINLSSNSLAFGMLDYVHLSANDYVVYGQGNTNSSYKNINNSVLEFRGTDSFFISCSGPVTFNTNSFAGNFRLNSFKVFSNQSIAFETRSFVSPYVGSLEITSLKYIYFAPNSLGSDSTIGQLWLYTNSNVTFGMHALENTQTHQFHITFLEDKNIHYDTNKTILGNITIGKQAFYSCDKLAEIEIKSHGTIFIDERAFENNQIIERAYIMADKKIHIGNNAFNYCNQDADISVEAPEIDASNCARGGSCKKRKTSGCSPDEYDKYQNSGAISLGNINISIAYLGLSPTIYVNLNFFIQIMKKARQFLGHIIPPPELVHSAIWVGESDASDDNIGAIFVYGKYYNALSDPSYLSKDGARAFPMTLKEFKRRYMVDTKRIIPQKRIKLFDFIHQLKASGKLNADDYNWPTNNCQHFTAKCINILHATREIPNKNDWINIPKPILKSLELNEED